MRKENDRSQEAHQKVITLDHVRHNVINQSYEGGSESSVIVVITLLIDMIACCIIP